jgi:hypothetical protein
MVDDNSTLDAEADETRVAKALRKGLGYKEGLATEGWENRRDRTWVIIWIPEYVDCDARTVVFENMRPILGTPFGRLGPR